MRAWLLLGIAIIGELVGTAGLKLADGFTHPWAWLLVVIGYGSAMWLLALVIQDIDMGVVYAVWSGVGIAITALVGIAFFHEQLSLRRAAGLFAIILGVWLLQQPATQR